MADAPGTSLSIRVPVLGDVSRLWLALGAATVLAIPFVLFTTFSTFSWFDDEGTLLAGFQSLRDGYRMYDEIYSLYGPLYNAVYGLIYGVLRIPLTHTSGRLMAVALWLIHTACFALFCYRLTRSIAAMLFSYMLVLLWLVPLIFSPGHPQEICLVLLAAVLLLTCSIERAPGVLNKIPYGVPRGAALAGIAIAVAGLALVKINIGVYVGGAVGLLLLRITTPGTWTRLAIPTVAATLLLLAFAVEMLLFDFAWVRLYCLFSLLVIGAALLVFLNIRMPALLRPADWWIIAAAGGLTCLIVIGGMILAGSSAYAILDAVLLQNTHFVRNWYLPLQLGLHGLLAAATSGLLALACCASASSSRLQNYRNMGVIGLKAGFVLFGAVFVPFSAIFAEFVIRPFNVPDWVFSIMVPFCWLIMVPPDGMHCNHALEHHPVARGAAGLIGAMMSLYPFPVAGSQVNTGALLPVLMMPILAHDVLQGLRQFAIGRRLASSSRAASLAMAAALALGMVFTLRSAREYRWGVPLGLPGTSLIHLHETQANKLRWVTAQLSSCASSYSMPGLLSFSFWTGHALPTALNINDVLAFITPAQQERIVQALSRQPDLCIVYNPEMLQRFDRGQIRTDPPLLQYILSDFAPIAERSGFIILKRRASGS